MGIVSVNGGARGEKSKQYQRNDRLEEGVAREPEKRIHVELCMDELKYW